MRYRNRVIGAGDALYVMHQGEWCFWTISDWSRIQIYGKRIDGPYEPIPLSARWDKPEPCAPRYVHRVALPPLVADIERQNIRRYGPTDNAYPPPPPPPTPEERRAERARLRAEKAAHLKARDECVAAIRARDLRDGICTISSGSMSRGYRY